MSPKDFPALYCSADETAVAKQTSYLRKIKLQYGLIVVAGLLGLGFDGSPLWNIGYAVAILGSSGLLIYMSARKPERDWYGCRALAESIKTSTWRYMMRAKPFEDSRRISEVEFKFTSFLQEIIGANRHVGGLNTQSPSTGESITATMNAVRALPLVKRKECYRKDRVDDQRAWYLEKAKANQCYFRGWVAVCVTVQGTAILVALLRIFYDGQWSLWPTAPLLVLVSSIIGWIQINKFTELASAYNLTAHEIGIIQTHLNRIRTEAEFSEFVNEAERAFSREHTQWLARRSA